MSEQIDQIKKEMKETARKVNFWTKVIFVVIVLCLTVGTILLTIELPKAPPHLLKNWIIGLLFCVPATISVIVFLAGLIVFQPEDRVMIEFLGKPFCVKRPGLRWICPILMRKRMIAFTWEQPIMLFPERLFPNGIHIDLKNGGKTEIVDPILWVQMDGAGTDREEENVLKMVYSVDDWEKAVREGAEDALRTCLNNLTVDEVLSAISDHHRASWWDAVKEYFPGLETTIKGYGFVPKRLTVSDFNWDEDVVKARQEVFKEERSAKIAELSLKASADEISQRAMEMGGLYGKMVEILRGNNFGKHSRKEAERIAKEILFYYQGTTTGSLIDVRAGGDGLAASLISTFLAVAKGLHGKVVDAQKTIEEKKEKKNKQNKKEGLSRGEKIKRLKNFKEKGGKLDLVGEEGEEEEE